MARSVIRELINTGHYRTLITDELVTALNELARRKILKPSNAAATARYLNVNEGNLFSNPVISTLEPKNLDLLEYLAEHLDPNSKEAAKMAICALTGCEMALWAYKTYKTVPENLDVFDKILSNRWAKHVRHYEAFGQMQSCYGREAKQSQKKLPYLFLELFHRDDMLEAAQNYK